MKKTILSLGITILFIISSISPIVFGYNFKIYNAVEHDKINSYYISPPEEEWNKTYGGLYHDTSRDVYQTSDDGFIITGQTRSFDSGGEGDLWILKTDKNGNEQWNKSYGGNLLDVGNSIKQTLDGGYIVTGWTRSIGMGSYDVWLLKTDNSGVEEWNKTFGGNRSDMGQSVIQTSDSGYLIVGNTRSFGSDDSDIWLLKTDSYGNQEWNITYDREYEDKAYYVISTNYDEYVVVGNTWVDNNTDIWLIKIDGNGVEYWNKTIGSSNDELGHNFKQTSDDGFIIVGRIGFLSYESGALLVKTDSNGFEEWNITYGVGEEFKSSGISVCQAGYLGFIFLKYTNIDSYHSYFSIVRVDDFGNELWNITYGIGEEYHYCRAIEMTKDGGYIICAQFDIYGTSLSDAWLIKLAKEIQPPSPPTIDGPTHGRVGVEYIYIFNSTDVDEHDFYYEVRWGDGSHDIVNPTTPDGTGPGIANHSWDKKGIYVIKARIHSAFGYIGPWGEFTVTMPRSKSIFNSLLLRFLEQYPLLNQFLQRLAIF